MVKMDSKNIVLLLGVAVVVCAFALPSVASAASWTPIGTTGRIDSGNLGFSIPQLGSAWTCPRTSFHVTIDSAAVATINAATFGPNCMGDVGSGVGCTLTFLGTNFPWRATAIDTTRLEIHPVDIDLHFETTPGTLNECSNRGLNIRFTGTVTAGYTPAAHTFDFAGALGLFTHFPGGVTLPAVALGNATPTGVLSLTD